MLRKMIAGMGWVSAYSILQMAANLALTMTLARLLTPEDFGVFALALVFVSFAQTLAQLGTNAAVVQFREVDPSLKATAFTMVLVGSIVVTAICIFVILGWLTVVGPEEGQGARVLGTLWLLMLSLPFFVVADLLQALYNRDLAFRVPAATEFLAFMAGFAGVSLLLSLLGFGSKALVLAYIVQHAMRTAVLFFRLPEKPWLSFNPGDARRILHFGVGFSIAKVGNTMALQADNLVVGSLLGSAALGLYSRSYQLVMSPISLITTIVDRVLFAAMSRRQDDLETLRSAFLLLNGAIFALFVPLSAIIYEFRREIVLVLLGNNWIGAAMPFGLLAVGLPFRAAYRLSDIVARSRGLVYRRAIVQWVYAGCVALGAALGTVWGLSGVALCVSAVIAVNWVMMTALTVHSLKMRTRDVIASMRASLFTLAIGYMALAAASWVFGREQGIAAPSIGTGGLAILAAVLAVALFQPVKTELQAWRTILKRAKRAG
ncbi:MAG: oligosaccharide flippase family protein [Fuscovulum sp.]|nr:oligosaccharide flippase family protein [Fuscovulum sp.]